MTRQCETGSVPLPGRLQAHVRSNRLRSWLLGLVVVLLLIGWSVTVVPSFQGWYFDDDIRNQRWTLEYRSTPWKALTQLHSMHDHVRPAMLLATWSGAVLSNGAWWGPHLVLAVLHLLGLAGLGVLAFRLSGRYEAALLAVFLAMSMEGYVFLAQWNAWICSAGEIACGLWGLVAIHRALQQNRWPWAGLGLLIMAGLFKEPGWLIYPLAAVAMFWQMNEPRTRRRLASLAALPLGLTGLLITWHPTNVFRTVGPSTSLLDRIIETLTEPPGHWIDTRFMFIGDTSSVSDGITVLLIAPVLLGALWMPRNTVTWQQLLWAALAVGGAVAGCLADGLTGPALLLLTAVILLRGGGPRRLVW